MPLYPNIRKNSDKGTFDFLISDRSCIKENCHNSGTSIDIDKEFGPVTKLNKRRTAASKKLTIISSRQIALSFFQFMANLEQSRRRIPNAWSVKLTFSLTETILQKLETELKNIYHSSHTLSKDSIFDKYANFLQNNADISKIKGVIF